MAARPLLLLCAPISGVCGAPVSCAPRRPHLLCAAPPPSPALHRPRLVCAPPPPSCLRSAYRRSHLRCPAAPVSSMPRRPLSPLRRAVPRLLYATPSPSPLCRGTRLLCFLPPPSPLVLCATPPSSPVSRPHRWRPHPILRPAAPISSAPPLPPAQLSGGKIMEHKFQHCRSLLLEFSL